MKQRSKDACPRTVVGTFVCSGPTKVEIVTICGANDMSGGGKVVEHHFGPISKSSEDCFN